MCAYTLGIQESKSSSTPPPPQGPPCTRGRESLELDLNKQFENSLDFVTKSDQKPMKPDTSRDTTT